MVWMWACLVGADYHSSFTEFVSTRRRTSGTRRPVSAVPAASVVMADNDVTGVSRAVTELHSKYRWCLTGYVLCDSFINTACSDNDPEHLSSTGLATRTDSFVSSVSGLGMIGRSSTSMSLITRRRAVSIFVYSRAHFRSHTFSSQRCH